MSSRGALIDAGMFMQLDIKKFSTEILHPCLSSHEQRKALSIVCRDICDGHGVGYIVEALEICSVKHDKIISLRRAHSDDIKTVYDWQCLPETRKFANIPQMPEWDGHVAWMGRKLRDFGCHFYIIQCDQSNAGVVRLDRKSIEDTDTFIVSIFIHPDFFGIGAASAGLSIVAKMHPTKTIFAQVHYDNTASVALFLRAGYKPQGDGWYILSPRLKQP